MKTKNKSFKRLFAFLVALVMVTALVPSVIFAADPTFKDVPTTQWAYDYIEKLAEKKIISGYGDGTFGPENNVTRQQAAKMIAKAADLEASKGFVSKFSDLDKVASELKPFVEALEENKVVEGYADGSFGPTLNIKRSQAAKMIVKAFGLAKGGTAVSFADPVSDATDQSYIDILASNGIVKGYTEDGKQLFKPYNLVTRAQLAKMIVEAMELELKIVEAKALNSTQVDVRFNKVLKSAKTTNFKVTDKDGDLTFISSVALNKAEDTATLTFFSKLVDKEEYALEASDLEDANGNAQNKATGTFKYLEADPAKVEFTKTTVAPNTYLAESAVKVTDALGKDITKEVTIEFESSNLSIVQADGKALAVGSSIVVAKVKVGTDYVKSARTTIKVQKAEEATLVGFYTYEGEPVANATAFLKLSAAKAPKYVYENDAEKKLALYYKDQYGNSMDAVTNNLDVTNVHPGIVIVNADGSIIPVSVGTGYVKVHVSKDFEPIIAIEVKAASAIATMELDPTTVKVSTGADVNAQEVKVIFKDQYGNKINATPTEAKVADTPVGVAEAATAENKVTITGKKAGTTTVEVSYKVSEKLTLKKTINVTVAKPGVFAGYEVVNADAKLDINTSNVDKTPITSVVKVFEVDANGVRISELAHTSKFTLAAVDKDGKADSSIVSASDATVTAVKAGTGYVQVKIGDLVEKTLTFTVVDTTATAKSASFNPLAISFDEVANTSTGITDDAIKNKLSDIVSISGITMDKSKVGFELYVTNLVGLSDLATLEDNDGTADVVVYKVTYDGGPANLLSAPVVIKLSVSTTYKFVD